MQAQGKLFWKSFLKAFGIVYLVFFLYRALFFIQHFEKFKEAGLAQSFLAFVVSIRLDAAALCFLLVLPFVLHAIAHYLRWRLFFGLRNLVFCLILAAVCAIHAGEIVSYSEWNHKLSSRVFSHLSNPDEVGRTAGYKLTFWFLINFSIGVFAFIFLARKWKLGTVTIKQSPTKEWLRASLIILTIPLMFLVARGGWQPIPINIDAAYYSNQPIHNDLAVNATYYFGKSFLIYNRGAIESELPQRTDEELKAIQEEVYGKKHVAFPVVLNTMRPNIVMVVLESWAANAIHSMGSPDSVTPYFDRLVANGLLFDSIYASSTTSDFGNAALLSGFPGVPETSIANQPERHRKLTLINQTLQPHGYRSSYLFSGDLTYGNLSGFLQDHQFDDIQDERDFSTEWPRGKLNYHDEYLYRKFLSDIESSATPFFKIAFTGSTHTPFDYPNLGLPKYKGEEADFMNSLRYADKCLENFIQEVQTKDWYKNTLFIFVADHGHATPVEHNPTLSTYFRIPLLWWGPALKEEYRGKRIGKIGGQCDLATTLLAQLKISHFNYPFSKNLLQKSSFNGAFHTAIRGYGWVRSNGNLTYHFDYKRCLDQSFKPQHQQAEQRKAESVLVLLHRYYHNL